MEDALHQEVGGGGTKVRAAELRAHAQSQVTRVLPRVEPRGLLQQYLHQTQWLHAAPEPRGAEHGRCARQDRVQERAARVGGDLGGSAGHRGGHRDRDEGGGDAVSRLRGAARLGRPELGLEPGGQPPAAQRGQSGQLSPAQQRAKVPGKNIA